jgi:hypothetical protein
MAGKDDWNEIGRALESIGQRMQRMNGGSSTHDTGGYFQSATASVGLDYEALIETFASKPQVVSDLREGVALLKRALGEYVMDAYVLTVVLKKIDWNQGDRTLQAQARDQLNRRIIW